MAKLFVTSSSEKSFTAWSFGIFSALVQPVSALYQVGLETQISDLGSSRILLRTYFFRRYRTTGQESIMVDTTFTVLIAYNENIQLIIKWSLSNLCCLIYAKHTYTETFSHLRFRPLPHFHTRTHLPHTPLSAFITCTSAPTHRPSKNHQIHELYPYSTAAWTIALHSSLDFATITKVSLLVLFSIW